MFFLPIWGFAFSQSCTGERQRPTGILLQASKTPKCFKAVSGTQLLNWLILIKAWIGQDLDLALALAMSGIQYPKNVKVCQRLVRKVKMYKQQGDTGNWVGKRGCASANDLFGLVMCPQLATAWGHRSSGTSLERRAPKPPLSLSPLASSYRGP